MRTPGGFSVLPAVRYPVSQKALAEGDGGNRSRLPAFQAAERAYIKESDDGYEICAKYSAVKISDLDAHGMIYANAVFPEDPYGPGVDPMTLTKPDENLALRERILERALQTVVSTEAHADAGAADINRGVDPEAQSDGAQSDGDPWEGMDGYFEGAPQQEGNANTGPRT